MLCSSSYFVFSNCIGSSLLYLTGNNPEQGDIRAGHGEGGVGGGAGRRDIQWACCLSNLWGPQSFAQPSVLMFVMFCRVEVSHGGGPALWAGWFIV